MRGSISHEVTLLESKALGLRLEIAAFQVVLALRAKFSPDQPRDSNGRWTSGSGSGAASAPDGTPIEPIRNGGIFANRPNDAGDILLPIRPHGYYRILHGPGLSRWVLGIGGEVYWSPDHYQSFLGPF